MKLVKSIFNTETKIGALVYKPGKKSHKYTIWAYKSTKAGLEIAVRRYLKNEDVAIRTSRSIVDETYQGNIRWLWEDEINDVERHLPFRNIEDELGIKIKRHRP